MFSTNKTVETTHCRDSTTLSHGRGLDRSTRPASPAQERDQARDQAQFYLLRIQMESRTRRTELSMNNGTKEYQTSQISEDGRAIRARDVAVGA